MLILVVGQGCSPPIGLEVGDSTSVVTLTANGECLVVGSDRVRLLQVKDGKEMTRIETGRGIVRCLAVSKDSRFIAAGTSLGDVTVWDTKTQEKVLAYTTNNGKYGIPIYAIDFSLHSTRLVVGTRNHTALIFDVATGNIVQRLHPPLEIHWVIAANYSPNGDRIATATWRSVHVWDSNNGRMLARIDVGVSTWNNTGLLWFNNHIFVLSDGTIQEFDASSGLSVSEWPVPAADEHWCISLPPHGEFIAHSRYHTITFWDTSTHAKLGPIRHPQTICSIAHSPDDQFLVIGGGKGKIAINDLSRITVSPVFLWKIANLNHFLVSTIFPRSIQSLCLDYTMLSGSPTFRSTALH